MNISLENPEMLLLLIPVIIVGFYFLRKTKTKIVEWRMLVAFLLVLALAGPFTTVSQTVDEENPSLVLIQDQTSSMGVFVNETGTRLYEALTANTPTSLIKLTGDKTSLGDAVAQYAGSGNQIVLVSDANNNAGKSLVEALEFAKSTQTPVYLVQPELKANDLSVEPLGDKTVVVDNQNVFEIAVRQASEQNSSYFLEVLVDGQLSQSREFTLNGRNNTNDTIPISQAFNTLGAHNLTVRITPSGQDLNKINNEFTKSLYVIPKPKITLVTNQPNSPLASVLNSLYEVSTVSNFPGGADALNATKVVVLDNQHIRAFSEADMREIKRYVSNGGGLIVVGGEKAYNFGNYLNSSLEEILPVLSKPSEYKGGRNLILILDVSPSTRDHGTQADILGNAIHILRNPNLKDANVAVIAFGSQAYDVSGGFVFLGLPQNQAVLEEKIRRLTTDEQSKTSLDQGLNTTEELLTGKEGKLDAIIISDGAIEDSYEASLKTAQDLKAMGVNLYFVQIRSPAPSQTNQAKQYYAELLMKNIGLENNYMLINRTEQGKEPERVNIDLGPVEKPSDQNEEENLTLTSYALYIYSPDNFITKNLNLTSNITGYNDVTPKAGAERLVITAATGKPVLTTWRYGLGRVAAFTTDNGDGDGTRWATGLYNGSNAKLISGMTNWAIANPRAETGAVVDAPDTWLGTPSNLTLVMYDEGIPKLNLDKTPLELALTGRNTYEASVNPESMGIHDISGYPLAVNYPLEYRDVGLNKDIEPLIIATGGKIYTEQEAKALLLKDARQNSQREVTEPVGLKVYILLLALLIYLSEIIARRLKEMKNLNQVPSETGK